MKIGSLYASILKSVFEIVRCLIKPRMGNRWRGGSSSLIYIQVRSQSVLYRLLWATLLIASAPNSINQLSDSCAPIIMPGLSQIEQFCSWQCCVAMDYSQQITNLVIQNKMRKMDKMFYLNFLYIFSKYLVINSWFVFLTSKPMSAVGISQHTIHEHTTENIYNSCTPVYKIFPDRCRYALVKHVQHRMIGLAISLQHFLNSRPEKPYRTKLMAEFSRLQKLATMWNM